MAATLRETARVETPWGKDWVRGWDDWKKEGPEAGPAVLAGEGGGGAGTSGSGGAAAS